jgi:hypothetical protein
LFALLLLAFPDVFFAGKVFVFRDFELFGYPLAHHYRQSLLNGEVPLWNPLNNCGLPFVAQWNTMVFYPLSLMHLVVPMPWSVTWFCLLHQFLGGLGMYLLARRWTNSSLAGAIAGIAYAFGGLMLSALMWPNNIAALGWLPWVLSSTENAWRNGRSRLVQAALVGAMQMLTGAPEIILFTWTLAGALFVAEIFRQDSRLWCALRFAAVFGLVLGLSAVQLAPFIDLLMHSQRSGGFAHATESALPLWGWANLLVPLFGCVKTSVGVFLQPNQFWVSSYYVGVTILALGLFVVLRQPTPRVWVLAGLACAGLVLALGDAGQIHSWTRNIIPGLSMIRFPVKFMVLPAVVFPLLAAFAVDRCVDQEDRLSAKTWTTLSWLTGSITLGIAALAVIAWVHPMDQTDPTATLRCALGRTIFFGLTLGAFYWLRHTTSARARELLAASLPFLVWLDFSTHVPRQNPTVDPSAYSMKLPPLKGMEPLPCHGESRAMLSRAALTKFMQTIVPSSFDGCLGNRLGLSYNCNMMEEIPKLDGFFSLYLPHECELRGVLMSETNQPPQGLLDFLGVSQLTAPESFMQWQARSTWMPMISAGQQPIVTDERNTLLGLMDPAFDPRRVVFLETQLGKKPVAQNAAAQILSTNIAAHHISTEIETSATVMVVFAQSDYHNWKATVDGQWVALWRANHAFQAVEVPAGRHTVELRYVDKAFRLGAGVSVATLLGCGLLLPLTTRRIRNVAWP